MMKKKMEWIKPKLISFTEMRVAKGQPPAPPPACFGGSGNVNCGSGVSAVEACQQGNGE